MGKAASVSVSKDAQREFQKNWKGIKVVGWGTKPIVIPELSLNNERNKQFANERRLRSASRNVRRAWDTAVTRANDVVDTLLPSTGRGYRIYREPDREPIDALAASMFAGDRLPDNPPHHRRYETQPRSRRKSGNSYFIRDEVTCLIKIGWAKSPIDRLKTLQTGSSNPLTLIHFIDSSVFDETELHQRFAHLRVRGEWFKPAQELLEFIERLYV